MIHLESNFVQFKEELLPKEGNKALLTFPFLHIYWTECCVSTGWVESLSQGEQAREPVHGPVFSLGVYGLGSSAKQVVLSLFLLHLTVAFLGNPWA